MSKMKVPIKVAKKGIKKLKDLDVLDKKTTEDLLEIAEFAADLANVPQEIETALSILSAIVAPTPISIGAAVWESIELLEKWSKEQQSIIENQKRKLIEEIGEKEYIRRLNAVSDKTSVYTSKGRYEGLPSLKEGETIGSSGLIIPKPKDTGWITTFIKKLEEKVAEEKNQKSISKPSEELITTLTINAQNVIVQGLTNPITDIGTGIPVGNWSQAAPVSVPEVIPPEARGLMMQPISAADYVPETLEGVEVAEKPSLSGIEGIKCPGKGGRDPKKDAVAQKKEREDALKHTQQTFGGMAKASEAFYKISGEKGGAAFELYKAFSIAEAGVATYNGATKALAELPFPVNFAIAASVVGAGIANIAQISAMQPGKKTSGSSNGSPGVGSASKMISEEFNAAKKKEEEEKNKKEVNIIINGDVVDPDDWFRRNAASVNRAMKDGVFE